MALDELKTKLADLHSASPQKAGLAAQALASVEEGLHQLAALGHVFELVAVTPTVVEWPKWLRHPDYGEVLVADQAEAETVWEDWKNRTLAAAKPEPPTNDTGESPPAAITN